MERVLTSQLFQAFLLLILLCAAVVFSFSDTRWREQIRNFTFDNYNIMKPREASDNIVVIDIDEASLAEIGQMPWPRTVMADMVSKLKDMGAAVIVFDIVFAEPDRSSLKEVAQSFKGKEGFEHFSESFDMLPDNDALFGQAIGQAGNVVTGFSFTNEQTNRVPAQKGIFRGKDLEEFVPNLRGVSTNLRVISRDAVGNGSFFVSTDTDGIIRRVPMLVAHKRQNSNIVSIYPSLALETIRVLDGERGGRVVLGDPRYAKLDPSRFGIEGVQVGKGDRFIPTNARGEFIVYFAKSNKDWYVPAHQILDGTYGGTSLKDKIVFVGTSAVGLKDIRSTPLDTFVPGVEMHLNIVDQILQGQYLSRSIEAEGLEAVSILLMGLFIIIFSPFIGAAAQSAVVGLVITGSIFGGWYAFEHLGMLVDITYPILSVIVIFMASTILTYLRTEKDRKQVRDAFGHYISPAFMKELTENPEKLKLGGEIKELTVLFSDIRNFTTISEGLTPEELIQLMNDFLTPMSDLVMENRGTIDKYMGDAMMAFWNAPLDVENHERHACVAALGMYDALRPINKRVAKKARKMAKEPVLLQAGIGINTGPCAVGNMGSKQRFAYSILGDAVNLASRLEGQTKRYGVSIIIGESTYNKVPDLAALEIDLIKVKGKSKPERIYALLGDEDMCAIEEFKVWEYIHNDMLAAYRSKEFEYVKIFAEECKALDISTLDVTYDLYIERAEEMLENPPDDDWDGVYEAQTK